MYAITIIVAVLISLGMICIVIAKKLVESAPENIDSDSLQELEMLVNIYYGGDISTRFSIALILGGYLAAEIVHQLINIGRK